MYHHFLSCFSENHCTVGMCHSPLHLPNVKSDSLVRNAQSKPQFFPISPYISLMGKTIKTIMFPMFFRKSLTVRMCHSPLYLHNVKSDSLVRNVQSKPPCFPVSPYISLMRKTIKTTIFPCFSENHCTVRMCHSPLYLPNVKSDSLVRNVQSKPQFFPISPSISLYLPNEKNNQNHIFSHVPPFFIMLFRTLYSWNVPQPPISP